MSKTQTLTANTIKSIVYSDFFTDFSRHTNTVNSEFDAVGIYLTLSIIMSSCVGSVVFIILK